jgi:predicted enzyme related to lactoylglutathione lyase
MVPLELMFESMGGTMPQVNSYEAGTPCWIDLATSDPEGSRRFYGELFGWELEVGPPEAMHYTQARIGGLPVAGLGGEPKPDEIPAGWTTYFATDDVDESVKLITGSGGTVTMGPMDVMDQGRMAIATDPQGAVFGLWRAGKHYGSALVNEPGTVCWNELMTPDLTATRRFYSAVFGYEWEDVDTGADGPAYATFSVGGRQVGGAMQLEPQQAGGAPPSWMADFAVADTDATVDKARQLGGAVSVPATDSSYGRFAILRDPHGGAFAVIRLAEES